MVESAAWASDTPHGATLGCAVPSTGEALLWYSDLVSVVVGLTGGIASGKSTVARLFGALGVPVVDADLVARDVVAPGSEGLRAVLAAFGDGVLGANGALDRQALGAIVFADGDARRKLEAITHPRIAIESGRRLAEGSASAAPYVLYEAALLVENGAYKMFPALIVVTAPEEVQRARIAARDGLDDAQARARIAAQAPVAAKLAVADWVIENVGDLAALETRVAEIHHAIVKRFSVDVGRSAGGSQ
jgi:dephospho-CoA kinase